MNRSGFGILRAAPSGRRRRGGSSVEAVVWEGSGTAWAGVSWGTPVERRLRLLGWQVTSVPWGDHGIAHRGRPGVLHVFSGGMEPVASGSAAMADRLAAVEQALATARVDECSVVGICLGAQMIAAVSAGFAPRPVTGGGEAGLTLVRGHGRPDLVVPTAHVAEVPEEFLDVPGVRHLWSNGVTAVQGFALGDRVAGVQFHPELAADEARRAVRSFRRALPAPPVQAPNHRVDPETAMQLLLHAAAAHRLIGAEEDLLVG
jgi:GMP synthase-like glutamine amidotransferase